MVGFLLLKSHFKHFQVRTDIIYTYIYICWLYFFSFLRLCRLSACFFIKNIKPTEICWPVFFPLLLSLHLLFWTLPLGGANAENSGILQSAKQKHNPSVEILTCTLPFFSSAAEKSIEIHIWWLLLLFICWSGWIDYMWLRTSVKATGVRTRTTDQQLSSPLPLFTQLSQGCCWWWVICWVITFKEVRLGVFVAPCHTRHLITGHGRVLSGGV